MPEVSESGFQGVSFNGGFDPEARQGFLRVQVAERTRSSNNSTVINGSGVGFGVGSNAQIEDGEKFEVLFDAPMTNATFGVRHNGGGELALTWIALWPSTAGIRSGPARSARTAACPPATCRRFIKLVITADGDHNAHLRISSIDGDIAGDPDDLEHLSFEVTGVDGDGDLSPMRFDIDINLISPLVQSAAFDGMVEEEHLQPNASGALSDYGDR